LITINVAGKTGSAPVAAAVAGGVAKDAPKFARFRLLPEIAGLRLIKPNALSAEFASTPVNIRPCH